MAWIDRTRQEPEPGQRASILAWVDAQVVTLQHDGTSWTYDDPFWLEASEYAGRPVQRAVAFRYWMLPPPPPPEEG